MLERGYCSDFVVWWLWVVGCWFKLIVGLACCLFDLSVFSGCDLFVFFVGYVGVVRRWCDYVVFALCLTAHV